jgi:hypothetical protein
MDACDKRSGKGSDSRRITDRRRYQIARCRDRRVRADRRLNNISVELIPFNEVHSHPVTRDLFCSLHGTEKKAVWLPAKDARDEQRSKTGRGGTERRPTKSPRINIFERNQKVHVEQRKMTDRRTQNIKLRYDRRVRPDRRLNNISVEWIGF